MADYIHVHAAIQERFPTSRTAAERRDFGLFNPDPFLTTSLHSHVYHESMQSRGELRIDPGQLGTDAFSGDLELVVPYTEPGLTRAILRKAVALTAGLQARISLVAVHAVPFPADFHCATATHTFLVDRLTELASECPLPVNPLVVLARSRQEGLRYALRPESTVLVGTYRHYFWRTSEERLARMLVSDGHKVALLHIEKEEINA